MTDENQTTTNPEAEEAHMQGTPTRAEVNQYLNNLFMTINNNIGVFHATNLAAITTILAKELNALGSEVTAEGLLKAVVEESVSVLKKAQENMAASDPEQSASPTSSREVDISVF